MKVIVQNQEVINKAELDSFIDSVPVRWFDGIEEFVVYVAKGENLLTSFHRKKRSFGVHIPRSFSGSEYEVFLEIACTLQAIQEFGHIPNTLPTSIVRDYLNRWHEFRR